MNSNVLIYWYGIVFLRFTFILHQDLSHFSLSDVPAEIFNLERTLESLNLESNNIRDLPRQLFHCQELRVLKLADNDLHILPNAVSSLAHLQGNKSISITLKRISYFSPLMI